MLVISFHSPLLPARLNPRLDSGNRGLDIRSEALHPSPAVPLIRPCIPLVIPSAPHAEAQPLETLDEGIPFGDRPTVMLGIFQQYPSKLDAPASRPTPGHIEAGARACGAPLLKKRFGKINVWHFFCSYPLSSLLSQSCFYYTDNLYIVKGFREQIVRMRAYSNKYKARHSDGGQSPHARSTSRRTPPARPGCSRASSPRSCGWTGSPIGQGGKSRMYYQRLIKY